MRISQATVEKILSKNRYFQKVYYFPKLISTNDFAKQADISNNSFIIANYQTNGRGRLNNKWISEKGKNLTFTLKQKLDFAYSEQYIVNFYYTFCVAQALENYLLKKITYFKSKQIEIKWPNDILLNGKKIGGILIEYTRKYYIIGIGININQTKFNFKNRFKPTSLKNEYEREFNKLEVLDSIINQFTNTSDLLIDKKLIIIFNLWKNKFLMNNKVVYINGKKGKIQKVNQNGSIVITIDNKDKIYQSGEISI